MEHYMGRDYNNCPLEEKPEGFDVTIKRDGRGCGAMYPSDESLLGYSFR